MMNLALIGSPVSHSLSPEIYSRLGKWEQTPVRYFRVDLKEKELSSWMEFARENSLRGFNVTHPLKESVWKFVPFRDAQATLIRAVNTVSREKNRFKAWNTDYYGELSILRERKVCLFGVKAAIFGAGGAARAMAFALASEGVAEVRILHRAGKTSRLRAQALLRDGKRFKPQVRWVSSEFPTSGKSRTDWSASIGFWINATPLSPELPLRLKPEALVQDLVYSPVKTPFLEQARKLGLPTIDGLELLCWQALANWKIWTQGRLPRSEEFSALLRVRKRLKREIQRHV